jgi:hypothetical protein
MTGVRRAFTLSLFIAVAGTGCATKIPPADAGQPHTQPIVIEDVPRHVDGLLSPLQTELLNPIRVKLRDAPVSASGAASDGSYTKWLTAVTETLVMGGPLPKDISHLSERAYRDLAHLLGRPGKRDAAAPDLGLLARRLQVYFETQSLEARKTAAAYIESVFSIVG